MGWLEGHHHPVLAGVQGLNGTGAVSQTQLPVHGGGSTASGPGAKDERIGFLGDQQLELGRDRFGGLTRSLNDVGAVIAGGQRRQGRFEGIGVVCPSRLSGVTTNFAPSATTTSP